jgi:hypothetical protein
MLWEFLSPISFPVGRLILILAVNRKSPIGNVNFLRLDCVKALLEHALRIDVDRLVVGFWRLAR